VSVPIKRALFSLDVCADAVLSGDRLKKMGWRIIATGETARELRKRGVGAEDVSSFVGIRRAYRIPPTLHPKIEEALTLDVPYRIDLVFDIPYRLSKGNDVGGRTLLALGAKGKRIVVFNSEDMRRVIKGLESDPSHRTIPACLHEELIDKAHAHIARHYLTLAQRAKESPYDGSIGKAALRLANGENPYQVPADLFVEETADNLSFEKFQLLSGRPCFTNIADVDCISHTLCLAAAAFQKRYRKAPYIAIASKHGNPCGMGADWRSPDEAVRRALFGNPAALWGGEFIANFRIDNNLGAILLKSAARKRLLKDAYWMLDVIAAPEFDAPALELLSGRSARKIFQNRALFDPRVKKSRWHYRHIRGGFLRQPSPSYVLDISAPGRNAPRLPQEVIDSLIIAWSVAYSSFHGGNEIALAKGRQLLAVGGGPSTVDAARRAIERSRENAHDADRSVFAADAFFPFLDAPRVLQKGGCRFGVVPSGGKREPLIQEFFRKNRMKVVSISAEFRGFYRH